MNKIAIAAVAALLTSAAAFAEEAPRLTGDFASQHVAYSDAQRGNIVGGGVAVISGVDEGRPVISYIGATEAQQGIAGQVPVVQNQGGRDRTIWVPAAGLRG
ncbi:hypothetical protein EOD42_10310 [Rhodovarius crocodyli]|uniref:Uncharacterized protein n=1 Tax=Rhodovarius crocodyli TaxID=1979269 RepID=A0A437MGK7_9PROT|nr:hypothetical protein [Rhodovarius crocodyli]RVT96790.1 hypothetical protein EOD42_10310 [Rhodovarius crocodyli]